MNNECYQTELKMIGINMNSTLCHLVMKNWFLLVRTSGDITKQEIKFWVIGIFWQASNQLWFKTIFKYKKGEKDQVWHGGIEDIGRELDWDLKVSAEGNKKMYPIQFNIEIQLQLNVRIDSISDFVFLNFTKIQNSNRVLHQNFKCS